MEKNHKTNTGHANAVLYHAYIGVKTTEGTQILTVPSLGLDLEYWISEKWGIGTHNDVELMGFEAQGDRDLSLKKDTPVLLTVDALWKPRESLVLLAGPGIELETEKSLFVMRTGIAYEIEIGTHWDLAPTLYYDIRHGTNDAFSVGIGIGVHL